VPVSAFINLMAPKKKDAKPAGAKAVAKKAEAPTEKKAEAPTEKKAEAKAETKPEKKEEVKEEAKVESKEEAKKEEPKIYICTTLVALTDAQDIKTGKAIRKLAVGETFTVLEGPVEIGGLTRLRAKTSKDEKEGWITLKGNAGTVYAKIKGETKEEKAEVKEEEPAKPPFVEETDAPTDSRKKIEASAVGFNMQDATLNAMPTLDGKLLMSLNDGGLQYFLTSIRANVAIKAGRYMFEVRMVECLTQAEPAQAANTPKVKQFFRVGFSLGGSSLFLGDGTENVCFDSEGFFVHGKKRTKYGEKLARNQTVAVLLNLDTSSPHAHTLSLFKDGVRISEPQALPENLRGKPLVPTITYKNVSLQVNFGPTPRAALPFKCRMLKDAAAADVDVVSPATSKCEAVFPVGLPDEGAFDWADQFLAANPQFTELSDRSLAAWAAKSGLPRKPAKTSNDKPDMGFGIPSVDDLSVAKVLSVVAPTLKRNYLIMELKGNLVACERAQALKRFSEFKKVASVIMGEPDAKYKEEVHKIMLAEKVTKVEAEREKKAKEDERKRLLEEKKRRAEEARKAKLEAQKKKEGGADGEAAAEEKKEEEAKEEAKEEVKEEEKEEDGPIELSEEEKKICHRKKAAPDLTQSVIAKSYASFTLPSKDEGFDEIKYLWQPQAECVKVLKAFVHERKMTQAVEDLQPGEWFKSQWTKWQTALKEMKARAAEYKDPAKRAALIKKKKEAAKKENGDAEGEEKEEEAAEPEAEENEEDEVDTATVDDIMDIGNCKPLFFKFAYEDWTLTSIRIEIHLLIHSFNKDLDDPDRPSFKEKDFAFYYQKYFKKPFVLKSFGVQKFAEFLEFVKDTVGINAETGFLETKHPDDASYDVFVKLTEEQRREIERRVDAGDETAKLKFTKPTAAAAVKPAEAQVTSSARASALAASRIPAAAGIKRPMAPATGGAPPAMRPRLGMARPAFSGGFYGR